jgi:type IV pilus assembly protein PilQ
LTAGAAPAAATATNALNVNLAAGASASPGTFAISLFNKAQTRFINLEISATESDGKIKIVSNPRVLTTNNVEALIEQGTDIPYQTTSASGTSTQFRKASLALRVKPQITPDGNVIMTLDVNKDSPNTTLASANGIPIDTKHVKTEVLVENGGTIVIGGIYTQNTSTNVNKVPMFGDIPIIGNLFKNTSRADTKTELIVFITPRIVEDQVGQR